MKREGINGEIYLLSSPILRKVLEEVTWGVSGWVAWEVSEISNRGREIIQGNNWGRING